MIKEIKYSGLSNVPSDYECPDGSMAMVVNMSNINGSLHPVCMPDAMFKHENGYKLIYIHKTNSYTEYIFENKVFNGIALSSMQLDDNNKLINQRFFANLESINSITSLGNVLIINTDEVIKYAIYKNGSYFFLGNDFPTPNIEVSASNVDEETLYFDAVSKPIIPFWSPSAANKDEIKKINEEVFSKINKYIADNGNNEIPRICFPILVRCALRLYDGSLIMHSPPKPLFFDFIPFKAFVTGGNEVEYGKYCIENFKLVCKKYIPYFRLSNKMNYSSEFWDGIISSVDIFASPVIYTINTNEKISYIKDKQNLELNLPIKATKQILKEIGECGTFYKIRSIPIGGAYSSDESEKPWIFENANIYENLTQQEVMSDDFRSHCKISSSGSYVYNNRLNLFNIKTKLFQGFSPSYFIEKTDNNGNTSIIVHIRKEDGQVAKVLVSEGGTFKIPKYFFYPERNAFEVEFYVGLAKLSFRLIPHPYLNAAYYISDKEILLKYTEGQVQIIGDNVPIIYSTNQVKQSEINNPFYFKPPNTYNVGSGEILGVCSVTKAISQGQFGQFPLYVFTSEGIWALEISSTGTYSAKQPATLDVCNNKDSITQIDGAIAFTTDQGLMLLQGSDSICISDVLDGESFDDSKLDNLNSFLSATDANNLLHKNITFNEYLINSRIAYSYSIKRLIVFNPEYNFYYMFSLKTKTWSTLIGNFKNVLNSYPDSFITNNLCEVINLSVDAKKFESVKGLVITRPIKLEMPNVFKTIDQIIQRGIFQNNKVKSVLYGSRDCIKYFPIASSINHYIRGIHGTPYKYFRLVIFTDFSDTETLSGASISVVTKLTNKLR